MIASTFLYKNFLLQNVVRADIFTGSLAVFEERGEPACGGRTANYGGFPSPPAVAKNVRTNLSIRSQ